MKKSILLTVLTIAFVTASCASVRVSKGDIDLLRERINAFYKAKIAVDYKEAFKYEHMSLDPRFTEQFYALNAGKSAMIYLDAQILSIELSDTKESATVKMKTKIELMPLGGFEKFSGEREFIFEDRWDYKNGNWYHLIKGMAQYW